jgi:RNA polymerase sigma-B factor
MSASGGTSRWTPEQRDRERELFAEFARLRSDEGGLSEAADSSGPSALRAVRDELVTMHLGLVHHLAQRYGAHGSSGDDVVQVGIVGLLNAVDRFDLDRGYEFSTFATPHIIGEMRKFFRDDSWAVHVPRRLRDLTASVNRARSDLSADLGRSPTVAELSLRLDVPPEEILSALEAATARGAASVDTPVDAEGRTHAETMGIADASFEQVENRMIVDSLLDILPEREHRIVVAKVYEELSQSQIAAELGISQVHVSRLFSASMDRMRLHAAQQMRGDAEGSVEMLGE